ncbi:acyl-CoA thioesterase [Psychroserpens sp.]|uniref:acyl-CoA thioesterase n=1 Tax=Psychroserpens sp. TaxID=2020870 RepID=UPI003C746B5B
MGNPIKSDDIEFRVRYGETDKMGVVYHGNYAQYFEIGRTEWLRKIGFSYRKMEADGLMLPVISLTINYKKSAHYDDLIKVKTKLLKMPGVKIEFEYEIVNENDELLTTGTSVLVFIDINKNRPTRCPQYLLDQLQY